jgi:hypothetical protein
VDEYESYRLQIERLLDLADEQLDERERDRLRVAIDLRHGDWLAIVRDTSTHNLAERLIGQLAEADDELTPEQVRWLEVLVQERLPRSP